MAEFWNEQPEQNGFFDKNNSKEIAYRRKMAERLLKQGEQDGTTQIVSGYAVKKSPLEGFAKALASGVGGYQERKADEMQNELDKKRSELMAKYVSAYGQDPVGASQILMQDPELSGDAMKMAVSSIDKQKELALKESDWQREAALKRELLGIRGQSGGGNGGATGYLINQYMESTGADFPTALYAVQTGLRQGLQMNDGQISPIQGVANSRGLIKKNEKIGTDVGEQTANAITDLPTIISNAQTASETIKNLSASEGLDRNLGMMSYFPNVAGSKASDAANLMEQLQGKTFLEAYQTLKGAGQITNIEGEKASQAIAALKTSQSPESYRKNLQDLQEVIDAGVMRAQQAARGNFSANPYINPNAGQGNPAINQDYSQIQPVLESDMNATVPQGNVMPPAPMGGMGEQPLSFNTPQEAEQANLPIGTVIMIGGRKAVIE